MTRKIGEQVVVITGASSGIGRATAIEFGKRGASIVLAARNAEALRTAAREVEENGGKVLSVLQRISRILLDRFMLLRGTNKNSSSQ